MRRRSEVSSRNVGRQSLERRREEPLLGFHSPSNGQCEWGGGEGSTVGVSALLSLPTEWGDPAACVPCWEVLLGVVGDPIAR